MRYTIYWVHSIMDTKNFVQPPPEPEKSSGYGAVFIILVLVLLIIIYIFVAKNKDGDGGGGGGGLDNTGNGIDFTYRSIYFSEPDFSDYDFETQGQIKFDWAANSTNMKNICNFWNNMMGWLNTQPWTVASTAIVAFEEWIDAVALLTSIPSETTRVYTNILPTTLAYYIVMNKAKLTSSTTAATLIKTLLVDPSLDTNDRVLEGVELAAALFPWTVAEIFNGTLDTNNAGYLAAIAEFNLTPDPSLTMIDEGLRLDAGLISDGYHDYSKIAAYYPLVLDAIQIIPELTESQQVLDSIAAVIFHPSLPISGSALVGYQTDIAMPLYEGKRVTFDLQIIPSMRYMRYFSPTWQWSLKLPSPDIPYVKCDQANTFLAHYSLMDRRAHTSGDSTPTPTEVGFITADGSFPNLVYTDPLKIEFTDTSRSLVFTDFETFAVALLYNVTIPGIIDVPYYENVAINLQTKSMIIERKLVGGAGFYVEAIAPGETATPTVDCTKIEINLETLEYSYNEAAFVSNLMELTNDIFSLHIISPNKLMIMKEGKPFCVCLDSTSTFEDCSYMMSEDNTTLYNFSFDPLTNQMMCTNPDEPPVILPGGELNTGNGIDFIYKPICINEPDFSDYDYATQGRLKFGWHTSSDNLKLACEFWSSMVGWLNDQTWDDVYTSIIAYEDWIDALKVELTALEFIPNDGTRVFTNILPTTLAYYLVMNKSKATSSDVAAELITSLLIDPQTALNVITPLVDMESAAALFPWTTAQKYSGTLDETNVGYLYALGLFNRERDPALKLRESGMFLDYGFKRNYLVDYSELVALQDLALDVKQIIAIIDIYYSTYVKALNKAFHSTIGFNSSALLDNVADNSAPLSPGPLEEGLVVIQSMRYMRYFTPTLAWSYRIPFDNTYYYNLDNPTGSIETLLISIMGRQPYTADSSPVPTILTPGLITKTEMETLPEANPAYSAIAHYTVGGEENSVSYVFTDKVKYACGKCTALVNYGLIGFEYSEIVVLDIESKILTMEFSVIGAPDGVYKVCISPTETAPLAPYNKMTLNLETGVYTYEVLAKLDSLSVLTGNMYEAKVYSITDVVISKDTKPFCYITGPGVTSFNLKPQTCTIDGVEYAFDYDESYNQLMCTNPDG